MKETQAVALQKLGEIVELGADKAVVAALTENMKNIDEVIKSLGSAARERLELAAQHEKLYDAVRKAQRRFVAAAGPAAIDAQTELYSIYAAPNFSQADAIRAHKTADQLADIAASGNLMAFDMIAALSTNNGDMLEAIGKEFRTAQARVKANVEALPKTTAMRSVQSTTLNLLALADGKTGVFKVRQQELDADDYGQTILEETRKLNVGLGISVQQLVDGVQKETDAATWQARQEISFGDHGHARRSASRRWSVRSCSSGSMSAATSCGGSATCSARCRCCPAATSNRRSIRPTRRTRSAPWRIRCRCSARA